MYTKAEEFTVSFKIQKFIFYYFSPKKNSKTLLIMKIENDIKLSKKLFEYKE